MSYEIHGQCLPRIESSLPDVPYPEPLPANGDKLVCVWDYRRPNLYYIRTAPDQWRFALIAGHREDTDEQYKDRFLLLPIDASDALNRLLEVTNPSTFMPAPIWEDIAQLFPFYPLTHEQRPTIVHITSMITWPDLPSIDAIGYTINTFDVETMIDMGQPFILESGNNYVS